MRRLLVLVLLLAASALRPAPPALAQQTLEASCDRPEVQAFGARDTCLAAVQAAVSAQPALGILIAGGNPTIGSAGAAGMRLGVVPRVSAGLRLNVVPVRLPDILAEEIGGQVGEVTRRFGAPAPALTADVAVGLTDGFSIAPGLGGMGGISLLGSATYIPFNLLDGEGFDRSDLAYGLGARLHLLRESFVVPGISISVMRRALPSVSFGEVCPGGTTPGEPSICPVDGDIGEFSFDLVDWSTRLVASKRLLGIGASAGIGHDRYESDVDLAFRGSQPSLGLQAAPVFSASERGLSSTRWTVFGNLSYTLIIATLGLEAGWQQGSAPITGFRNLGSDFDPRGGTWFGSLGARISL